MKFFQGSIGIPYTFRLLCIDRDYSQQARVALAYAGSDWMPPQIKKTSDVHKFRVSCGGSKVQAWQYARQYLETCRNGDARCVAALDSTGKKLVAGTIAAGRLDGGFFYDESKRVAKIMDPNTKSKPWIFGRHNDHTNKAGLKYDRRRSPPGANYTTMTIREEIQNSGNYRPHQGGFTSTCCPPPGLTTRLWTYFPVPRPTDTVIDIWNEARRCDQQSFGETTHCDAEMSVVVKVCRNCNCKSLLDVTTHHKLMSTSPGCKVWFALMDTAVRNLVAAVRKEKALEVQRRCNAQGGAAVRLLLSGN